MEREDIYKILLYLVLWLLLIKDFGFGLWRAVIYISATIILYFENLGKYEIDWLMWLKIYAILVAFWILKRIIYKDFPSLNFGSRYLFF
ncbi:MAG: hypothetical protein ACE5HY_03850 [Candidatus Hydrothermarchaeales archaeon]